MTGQTPDSFAICFHAVSGSPLSLHALTHHVHLLTQHSLIVYLDLLLKKNPIYYRSQIADFPCAQIWDHRCTMYFIVLFLRDLHHCESQCSCGLNYLSHPPTQPCLSWISHLCEFSRMKRSIFRVSRLLHVRNKWRAFKGNFKAPLASMAWVTGITKKL